MKWTEKYAPKSFDEVIGNKKAVHAMRYYTENPMDMPHLMLAGATGTGKTTLASLLRKSLGISGYNYDRKNCSNETGVDTVRKSILNFMRHVTLGDDPFKLLVLEESEELSRSAQNALKMPLEKYWHNCRVIFITNHPNSFIKEIREGRCDKYDFVPLGEQPILERLQQIAYKEDLHDVDISRITRDANGNMREAIAQLQRAAITGNNDDEIDKLIKRYETPISSQAV